MAWRAPLALLLGVATGSSSGPLFATHLMVWQSHTEPWWKPGSQSGYRVLSPGGELRDVDWLNATLAAWYLDQVKDAGMAAVIVDLTNSFERFLPRIPALQTLCWERGLKLAAQIGAKRNFEKEAEDAWNLLVQGDSNGTYLTLQSRPVLVAYVTRLAWDSIRSGSACSEQRFSCHWSSGEDSVPDKWGWQIEPFVGPEPSTEAVYVTPSTGHFGPPQHPDHIAIAAGYSDEPPKSRWRKSLAMLDYSMLVARRSGAGVVVVGSYDDIQERNGWLAADTAGALPQIQMRGPDGAVTVDGFFNRVKTWSSGRAPAVVPGGSLRDGAYIIRASSGAALMMFGNNGSEGDPLVAVNSSSGRRDVLHEVDTNCSMCGRDVCRPGCEPQCCAAVANVSVDYFVGANVSQIGCGQSMPPTTAPLVCSAGKVYGVQEGTALLFWLYHLGGGFYRVLPLNSGLALAVPSSPGAAVRQQLSEPGPSQHWCLHEPGYLSAWVRRLAGEPPAFRVVACDGGGEWQLTSDGSVVLSASSEGDGGLNTWTFHEVATL